MINVFEEFERRFNYLTEEEKLQLISISEIREYKSGKVIVSEGDITYNCFLVVEGILRTFFTDENGNEKTLFIANEGLTVASADNLLYDRAASEAIMAVEDSVVIVLDTKKLDELSQQHIGLMHAYKDSFKENLKEAIERLEFYTKYKPKERYFHLMNQNPDLILRVPQKYLASYLGMKPESLSRIKKQSINKK